MATLLTRAGANLTVQLLLETLQQTMEFESSTAKKLGAPVSVYKSSWLDVFLRGL
jgi:hypothetical protein